MQLIEAIEGIKIAKKTLSKVAETVIIIHKSSDFLICNIRSWHLEILESSTVYKYIWNSIECCVTFEIVHISLPVIFKTCYQDCCISTIYVHTNRMLCTQIQ